MTVTMVVMTKEIEEMKLDDDVDDDDDNDDGIGYWWNDVKSSIAE